jgi:predicted nucleic acid-binding protein
MLTPKSAFPVALPTEGIFDAAMGLTDRHQLSLWDAMIVAACIQAGVDRLYTEDMGSPRRIEQLELINPFAA